MIPIGNDSIGSSIGSSLSDRRLVLKSKASGGSIVRKRPVSTSVHSTSTERVVVLVRGTSKPHARNALATREPGTLSGGGKAQGSLTSSASAILRRRLQGLAL